MSRKVKYSYEQKLAAVQSYLAGEESQGSIASKLGCSKTDIQRWLAKYKYDGAEGLRMRNGNTAYTSEFKLSVIRYILDNDLTSPEAAAYFGIPAVSCVQRWVSRYENQGPEGLLAQPKGRKKTMALKKINKSIAKTAEDKIAALEAELEYLRTENAFLKKLRALIQEEKAAKLPSRRQKPSTN